MNYATSSKKYKTLENKSVQVNEFGDKAKALTIIEDALKPGQRNFASNHLSIIQPEVSLLSPASGFIFLPSASCRLTLQKNLNTTGILKEWSGKSTVSLTQAG